jgi:hypothetical protein
MALLTLALALFTFTACALALEGGPAYFAHGLPGPVYFSLGRVYFSP